MCRYQGDGCPALCPICMLYSRKARASPRRCRRRLTKLVETSYSQPGRLQFVTRPSQAPLTAPDCFQESLDGEAQKLAPYAKIDVMDRPAWFDPLDRLRSQPGGGLSYAHRPSSIVGLFARSADRRSLEHELGGQVPHTVSRTVILGVSSGVLLKSPSLSRARRIRSAPWSAGCRRSHLASSTKASASLGPSLT